MFQMPRSLNYQTSEPQSELPRGFYDPNFPQISQPQPPGKQILVPFRPGVRDPNFESCDVPTVQRIPCGGFGITATSCETMSCCFDGRNCYYPKYQITKPQPPEKEEPFPVKTGVRDPNFESCDVPTVQRIPCGGFGITATSCETMSCCFDGRNCYYPKYHITKPQPPEKEEPFPVKPGVRDPNFESCDVPTVQRIPCGGFGITATSCETMSCCFDGRNCYYPKYQITKPQPPEKEEPFPVKPGVRDPNFETCDVPTVQRIPCGGFGITATSCETMSCCFDGRNCYYPKYQITKPQPPEKEEPFPVKPGVRDPNFESCDVPTVQRIPCGGFGITATSCETMSCCFDGRNCYHPKYQITKPQPPEKEEPFPVKPGVRDPTFESCDVPTVQRIPCGGFGITATSCETMNCCFDGLNCYYPKYQITKPQPPEKEEPFPVKPGVRDPNFESCDVPTVQRIPCGGFGITATSCETMSCCFDGRNCYYPKYQITKPQPPEKEEPFPVKPGVRDPNFETCDVPTVQRIPCGGFGITATSCETMSCCFDGRNCYYPKYQITKPQPPEKEEPFPVKPGVRDPNFESCDVPTVQRIPCAGFGITATSCETMSCCFDGRNCYYPKYLITKPQPPEKGTPFPVRPGVRDPNFESCDVPTVQRIPCGGFGITATSCKTLSCCFDGRNCYYPKYHTINPKII
ncbi:uncharacterized protein LOC133156929, partial [Syngnathus typhle]|uniref:uncharacterized protein LOC133156929 n=1 Tax=Syngnathus typhle TaxID=161592 RepID=UPI002A6ACFC6